MLDSAPSSVLYSKKWVALTARCHCSGFEIDKPMEVVVAIDVKAERCGDVAQSLTARI
jgi:hypothetical protein